MKNNAEYIKNWIAAAGVRAMKTVAQTAIASIGTAAMLGAADWRMVASASLLAGVLSLLTSVAGLPEVEQLPGVAGLPKTAQLPEAAELPEVKQLPENGPGDGGAGF